MKTTTRLLITCATGGAIIASGSWAARAADQAMPVKAPVVVEEGWWYKGYIELGARGFLNDPKRDGVKGNGTGDSLAKFYEYRDLREGGFGNGWFATGSKNGLYQLDGWAKNVGYTDQAYELNWSKAGEHYLTVDWDQTPHVYSTSALTPYFGVGSNHLTLAPGLSATLFGPAGAGCVAVPNAQPAGCATLGAAAAARVQTILNGSLHHTDLGITRDTGSVEYRYTPTDDWDVRVNYSLLHRYGTQVDGVAFSPGTSGVRVDAPRPIDDITQNYGASGEYVGTSPWSQRYTFKLGYSGSTYTNRWDSYTVDNPFCPAGAATNTTTQGFCARNGSPSTPLALVSLAPDNQVNGGSATLGADLPYKSRYMGTFSYNVGTQNQQFLPFTLAPTVFTNAGNTTVGAAPTAMPASSLNGQINTLLSNNVLTTQITPELKNKANYRIYDFDNNTPLLRFAEWVVTDAKLATVTGANNAYAPVSNLPVSYTKQNAGDELVWRPTHNWNVGTAFNWERYDWKFESADRTDEFSGKVFADWKPSSELTVRGSWLLASRTYSNYDYNNNLANIQFPGVGTPGNCVTGNCSTHMVSAMRNVYLNERVRDKAQIQVDWEAAPRLVLSPTAGLQFDDYHLNAGEIGMTHNRSWRAGVEATYLLDPRVSFLFSYMYEQFNQNLTSSTATGTGNPFAAGSIYFSDIMDRVHTFVAATNITAIPDRLDLRLNYAVSFATDQQNVFFGTGAGPATGPYPKVNNVWQRFDATAKYRFDPDWVHSIGWKGDVYAKLMYAWERNSQGNWQIDEMQNYMFNVTSGTGYMTWMAFDNPNYNVHMLAGAIGFAW
jgi:MtrB/PioB family decaheme-associated outer membrane protein